MDNNTFNLITQAIASLGFPIFVAIYLLTHMRTTIDRNTDAINQLIAYLKARNGHQ